MQSLPDGTPNFFPLISVNRFPRLSSGCNGIDEVLKGGVPITGLFEICGEAGSGKTNFALQLCLQVQLPVSLGGLDGGALYISTEGPPSASRLAEMAMRYSQLYPNVFGCRSPCDNIFIEIVDSVVDQMSTIATRVPQFLATDLGKRIRLVIIDSIASLFRIDFDVAEGIKRSFMATSHGAALRKLCITHNVAIVVTNQVSDLIPRTPSVVHCPTPQHGLSIVCENKGENNIIPAMGLAWSNIIHTRVMLRKSFQSATARELRILFSPHLKSESALFSITSEGLVNFCK